MRSCPVIQIQPGRPEQRIGVAAEVANQWADPPPLDQPAPAARLPQTAGLPHQVIEVLRAADSDPLLAEAAEQARTDRGRQVIDGERGPCGTLPRRGRLKEAGELI